MHMHSELHLAVVIRRFWLMPILNWRQKIRKSDRKVMTFFPCKIYFSIRDRKQNKENDGRSQERCYFPHKTSCRQICICPRKRFHHHLEESSWNAQSRTENETWNEATMHFIASAIKSMQQNTHMAKFCPRNNKTIKWTMRIWHISMIWAQRIRSWSDAKNQFVAYTSISCY